MSTPLGWSVDIRRGQKIPVYRFSNYLRMRRMLGRHEHVWKQYLMLFSVPSCHWPAYLCPRYFGAACISAENNSLAFKVRIHAQKSGRYSHARKLSFLLLHSLIAINGLIYLYASSGDRAYAQMTEIPSVICFRSTWTCAETRVDMTTLVNTD